MLFPRFLSGGERIGCLTRENICSMGLRSGEQAGKNIKLAPACSRGKPYGTDTSRQRHNDSGSAAWAI